jgi:hypothetical protein
MAIGDILRFMGISALLVATAAQAQSFDPSALKLLTEMNRQPNVLARYAFLIKSTPQLSPTNHVLAGQFRSFSENELGLYNQAVFSFPLTSRLPDALVLPTVNEWRAEDAVETIFRLAVNRHIVMINEAHHDAHTRELTLALLPRLRELGFTYFAAEALSDSDDSLMQRGFPTKKSGTEYLDEPIYGEIIREAIRLGFTVVPYDSADSQLQGREDAQAKNLYRRIFANNPNARVFIHAGYAHIDKKPGRLRRVKPMGMQLKKSTGFDPLCIDQTDFLESGLNKLDAYHSLVERFPSKKPVALINRKTGDAWSARPTFYDVNILLPPSLQLQAFGVNRLSAIQQDDLQHVFANEMHTVDHLSRPKWLKLGGVRRAIPIDSNLCKSHIPCVVSAHYINEPDEAIPADRYAFMQPNSTSKLFLKTGNYRMRAWDVHGTTLYDQNLTVNAR